MPDADLAESPPDFDKLATRARAAARRQDWGLSLSLWSEARRLFPLEPGGHVGVVESLIALGRVDEAQAALSEASTLAPDNPEFRNRPATPGGPPAATMNIEMIGSHEPELTGVLLSRDPIVIHSVGASFESIVSSTMEFYQARGRRAHYLLSATSGLTTHTAGRDRLAREATALRERFPDVSMTLLVNDVLELTAAWPLGIDVELVNGGCFVDEYTYTIDPTSLKRFDAICDLRAGSPDRHRLAGSVASVVLLAQTNTDEAKVADIINTAHCALCLSRSGEPQEATVEYLLCGVPIVTSRGVGARDWWLNDEIAIFADDTPQDIAAAVARMRARALPPVHVRQTALHRLQRERAVFFGLVDQVFAAHGQPARRFEPEFLNRFTHRWHERQRKLSAFATGE